MRKFSRRKFSSVILLLCFTQIYASAIMESRSLSKKKSNTSKEMDDLVYAMSSIPLIGNHLWAAFLYAGYTINISNTMTFGLIASILRSTEPCVINVQSGLVCKGLSDKNLFGILENVINDIPSNVLPDFSKALLLNLMRTLSNRIISSAFTMLNYTY